MKGWYLLSKEAEPSFRFTANHAACADWDLIAVVPWSLNSVLSGAPIVHPPFVEQASYAANMRTYYWQVLRRGKSANREITFLQGLYPYPPAGTPISDVPASDGGGNFGRVARVQGLMDEWKEQSLELPLAGIAAEHWIRFLTMFTESTDPTKVAARIQGILRQELPDRTEAQAQEVVALLDQLRTVLG